MRAVRWHGHGDVRVDEVAEPEIGPRDVKVRVSYNGICGSDVHEFYGDPVMVPLHPHPLTGVQVPVVLGHECGGVVAEVGSAVDDIEVGTLVAIEPIIACGRCPACRSGEYNFCELMAFHGYSGPGGGMAEFTVADRSMVHPMDASLTGVHAALVEPMAVSYHAVQRSEASEGDLVVVHGAGPIGLGAVFALQALGVEVVVSEPGAERRQHVERYGIRAVVDPTTADVAEAVADLTNGRGARASIDAAGAQQSFTSALRTTGRHGTVVIVGVPRAPLELRHRDLFRGEIQLRASVTYCGDFPRVIEDMEHGRYPTDWVSFVPMEGVVDALHALHDGAATKVLVDPTLPVDGESPATSA
jgi:(R,R)-butanediol dehydrogenase/meso-butanediol dehydrogenase/diacetyl reductase